MLSFLRPIASEMLGLHVPGTARMQRGEALELAPASLYKSRRHSPSIRADTSRRFLSGAILAVLFSASVAGGALYPEYSEPTTCSDGSLIETCPSEVAAYRASYYDGFAPTEAWALSDVGLWNGHEPVDVRVHGRLDHDRGFRAFFLEAGTDLVALGIDPFDPREGIVRAVEASRWGVTQLNIYETALSPADLFDLVPTTSRIWGGKVFTKTGGAIGLTSIIYSTDPVTESHVHEIGGAPRAVCWRPDLPDQLFVNATSGTSMADCTFAEAPASVVFIPLRDFRHQIEASGAMDCVEGETDPCLGEPCIAEGSFSSSYCVSPGSCVSHVYEYVQDRPLTCVSDFERRYVEGEYMTHLRVKSLALAARNLAFMYAGLEDGGPPSPARVEYGQKAVAILYSFAKAFPSWSQFKRFGDAGPDATSREVDRDNDVDDMAGFWFDRIHSGYKNEPTWLAIAYEILSGAPPEIWEPVNLDYGGDARVLIEEDFFKLAILRSIRFDTHPVYGRPNYVLDNRAPYQITGLLNMGAAIGAPEVVRYALWKTRQILTKELMHDGVWPEGPSYHHQVVSNFEIALLSLAGARRPADPWPATGTWSEDLFFSSDIASATLDPGREEVGVDLADLLETVEDSHDVLDTFCRPDGYLLPLQDTPYKKSCGTRPANWNRPLTPIGSLAGDFRPFLLPGNVRGTLGRGELFPVLGDLSTTSPEAIRIDLGAGANWGHVNFDRLSMLLWNQDAPLVYERGEKRAHATLNHNTVRIDQKNQAQYFHGPATGDRSANAWPGEVLAFHPVPDEMQVLEIEDRFAYWGAGGVKDGEDGINATRYRRTLFLIPLADPARNLVLDVFDVATDLPHRYEWLSHSRPDGAAHELEVRDAGGGVLASWTVDPHHFGMNLPGEVLAGGSPVSTPLEIDFKYSDVAQPDLHLRILEPATVEVAKAVSETNGNATRLSLARDSETSTRFVALWEPIPGGSTSVLSAANLIAGSEPEAIGVGILLSDGTRIEVYDNPMRSAVDWDDGAHTRGRFVGVRSLPSGEVERLWMYEADRYQNPSFAAHAFPRSPRFLGEPTPTLDPLWDPSRQTLDFDPVARTSVDPQWMVQLRTRVVTPDESACIRHSRWIPVTHIDSDLETLLSTKTEGLDFGGRGYVLESSVGETMIRDAHSPHRIRRICATGDNYWSDPPQIVWPERAVLFREGDDYALVTTGSNVPMAYDRDRTGSWVGLPEPGLEGLWIGLIALAGSARRMGA